MRVIGSTNGTAYRVWNPDRGATKDDGLFVRSYDPEGAAKAWAEWDDANTAEYSIVSGNDATVVVAEDCDGAPEHRFTVSGESCPVYRARAA